MGTDIYLRWQGIGKEEKEKQITGWSIAAGDAGYLRASIGMVEENSVLRVVFPEEFWKDGEEREYDFKGNFDKMIFLVKQYLFSRMTETELNIDAESENYRKFGESIALAFTNAGAENVRISGANDTGANGFGWDLAWANSLTMFFRLGMEKQKEGKKPTVYISW